MNLGFFFFFKHVFKAKINLTQQNVFANKKLE